MNIKHNVVTREYRLKIQDSKKRQKPRTIKVNAESLNSAILKVPEGFDYIEVVNNDADGK